MSDWIVTVFLGDSLTAGFQQGPGYLPPRYYPFTNLLESSLRRKLVSLESERDIAVVNQGMDGDSTRGMLERFSRGVEPEKPDMVLIWGGINDLSSMVVPVDVYENIVKLVERTVAIGAKPIVLNVAPVEGVHFNETVKELNKLTEAYCTKNDVILVDVFSLLVDEEEKLDPVFSNDGVHLSDRGYQKILPVIFAAVMKSVADLI